MAGRYDSNPFAEDDVNPFAVSRGFLSGSVLGDVLICLDLIERMLVDPKLSS